MLSPILVIGDSKRYEPLFTALKDIEIVAEQVPSPSEGLVVQDGGIGISEQSGNLVDHLAMTGNEVKIPIADGDDVAIAQKLRLVLNYFER